MSFVAFVNNFLRPGFRCSFPRLVVSSEFNKAIQPFLPTIHDDFQDNLITALNSGDVNHSPNAEIIKGLVKQIQKSPTKEFFDSINIFDKIKEEIPDLIEYLKNSIIGLENIKKIGEVLSKLYPPLTDSKSRDNGFSGFWKRDKCPELMT
jgi:hypothetical protein